MAIPVAGALVLGLGASLGACTPCPKGFGPGRPDAVCSDRVEIEAVGAYLSDFYVFRSEVPELRTGDFQNAQELLDRTVTADQIARGAFAIFEPRPPRPEVEPKFGFWVGVGSTGELILVDVFQAGAGSPAAEAGLRRGDKIVGIEGVSILELGVEQAVTELAEAEAPLTLSIERAEPPSSSDLTLAPRALGAASGLEARAFDDIGYLRVPVMTASVADDLSRVFAPLRERRRWIIDVRFVDGGRFTGFKDLLDALLGGTYWNEMAFWLDFGEGLESCDEVEFIDSPEHALVELEEVVLIHGETTDRFAQQLWNSLRVYVPVRVVGEQSNGGGSYFGYPGFFCGKRLWVADHENLNADGGRVPLEGIPVDCAAEPDLRRNLGDPDEPLLAAALAVLGEGTCPEISDDPEAVRFTPPPCEAPRCRVPLL